MTAITFSEFSDLIIGGSERKGRACSLRSISGDRRIPSKIVHVPGSGPKDKPLVISFHGSIDQSKRQGPQFWDPVEDRAGRPDATLIALGDPSLNCSPTLTCAWYAGDSTLDTPRELACLFDLLQERLEPSRIVFAGRSTGGHPALLHGFRRPRSVSVVFNPIVSMKSYAPNPYARYKLNCWPELAALDREPDVCIDVSDLYSSGHENVVIYLQNATDHGPFNTLMNQALHFASRVKTHENMLFLTEYMGVLGHRVPASYISAWTTAAIVAPDSTKLSIADRALSILGRDRQKSATNQASSGSTVELDAIENARRVSSYLLEG